MYCYSDIVLLLSSVVVTTFLSYFLGWIIVRNMSSDSYSLNMRDILFIILNSFMQICN